VSNLKAEQEARREVIESGLSGLGIQRILNHQARLRVQQAVRRDPGLQDLLEPVEEYLAENWRWMERKQELLGEVWRERNRTGW